jgi:uncharacterized protein (DUF2384 family)
MKSKSFKRLKVYKRMLKVFGALDRDSSDVEKWFTSTHAVLGFKSPLALSKTKKGTKQIEDLLGRLEHGVFT